MIKRRIKRKKLKPIKRSKRAPKIDTEKVLASPRDFNFLPLDDKLQNTCDEFNLLDPVVLLIGAANGIDLSSRSKIYERILELENEYGENVPDPMDYSELTDLIRSEFRYTPIERKDMITAQKTLSEFMHAKKKALDIKGMEETESGKVEDLTRSEIRLFKKRFDEHY